MLSVECLQCNTKLSPHQGKGGELLLENVREADLTSFDCSQYFFQPAPGLFDHFIQ